MRSFETISDELWCLRYDLDDLHETLDRLAAAGATEVPLAVSGGMFTTLSRLEELRRETDAWKAASDG